MPMHQLIHHLYLYKSLPDPLKTSSAFIHEFCQQITKYTGKSGSQRLIWLDVAGLCLDPVAPCGLWQRLVMTAQGAPLAMTLGSGWANFDSFLSMLWESVFALDERAEWWTL